MVICNFHFHQFPWKIDMAKYTTDYLDEYDSSISEQSRSFGAQSLRNKTSSSTISQVPDTTNCGTTSPNCGITTPNCGITTPNIESSFSKRRSFADAVETIAEQDGFKEPMDDGTPMEGMETSTPNQALNGDTKEEERQDTPAGLEFFLTPPLESK